MEGFVLFFCQAEDGIRDLVRSRGLGDVYKRQGRSWAIGNDPSDSSCRHAGRVHEPARAPPARCRACLLYTSDAADERSSVDLGGRRIIKKKKRQSNRGFFNIHR